MICIAFMIAGGIGGGPPTEVATLTSALPEKKDFFGYAVAVDGDTAVVGAYDDHTAAGTDAGSATVFERGAGGTWVEVKRLEASDAAPFDQFGRSVAIDGDTIVVGALLDDHGAVLNGGSVYVFERDLGGPDNWGEATKLVSANVADKDHAGDTVAIDGDTVLVGAPGVPGAHVFERHLGGPGAWGEAATMTGLPFFPIHVSVALEGDLAVFGDGTRARVYERNAGGPGAWGLVDDFTRLGRVRFSYAVALSGGTLVVGDPDKGGGEAYVYEQGPGGTSDWVETAVLTTPLPTPDASFGRALDFEGEVLVVGAPDHWQAAFGRTGSVQWFERHKGGPHAWGHVAELVPASAADDDGVGTSVALGGSWLLVGAPFVDHPLSAMNAGSAFVFEERTNREVYCTSGVSSSGCQARIAAGGVPSASAPSGFDLSVLGAEGAKDGLFFYGSSGRQANPWGNGTSYVCVAPPRSRSALLAGVGTSGYCNGAFSTDLNARWCPTCTKPAHNPGAGAQVQAQLWYRDPENTGNQTSSLSDAIEFCVGP